MQELVQEMTLVVEEGGYHEVDNARTLVDMSGVLDRFDAGHVGPPRVAEDGGSWLSGLGIWACRLGA